MDTGDTGEMVVFSSLFCEAFEWLMRPQITFRIEEESWRRSDGRREWRGTVGLKKKAEERFRYKEERNRGVRCKNLQKQ